jgi:hypothetical protein
MEQYKDEKAFLAEIGDVNDFRSLAPLLQQYKAYLIDQAKKGKLTLQECKDMVAKKNGHGSWDFLCFAWAGFIKQIEPFMNEAAEMYANQFVTDAPESTISTKQP